MRGKIKWFDPMKGFGWITLHSGEAVYVHGSALRLGETPPTTGLEVELEILEGPGGKQAIRVRPEARPQ